MLPPFPFKKAVLYSGLIGLSSFFAACSSGGGSNSKLLDHVFSSSSSSSQSSAGSYAPRGLSALTNIPLGVAVDALGYSYEFEGSQEAELVRNNFSQITFSNAMKMSYWDPDTFENEPVDAVMEWAYQNGLSVHGHTLIWHPCYQLPEWANSSGNYTDNLLKHIAGVAGKYEADSSPYNGMIVSWDVVNEALYDSADDKEQQCSYQTGAATVGGVAYRQSAHYLSSGGPGYIETAFRAAAVAAPTADLYYNDYNLSNNGSKMDSLVTMVTEMINRGVPIDGVGFQMHVLSQFPTIENMQAAWQKVVNLGLKVKITELDVRINNPYNPDAMVYTNCDDGCDGWDTQAQRYQDIIEAYFATVPAGLRGGITLWGISDRDSWYGPISNPESPDWPLLWSMSLEEKPAYDSVEQALINSN